MGVKTYLVAQKSTLASTSFLSSHLLSVEKDSNFGKPILFVELYWPQNLSDEEFDQQLVILDLTHFFLFAKECVPEIWEKYKQVVRPGLKLNKVYGPTRGGPISPLERFLE
jgi:hypothetical protein